MLVKSRDDIVRQVADGPEDAPPDLLPDVSVKRYAEHLESQRELLAQLVLSSEPLTMLDRQEIAYLLCPELFQGKPKRRGLGRPKGTKRTLHRDFRIALEYEELRQKDGSESAYETLRAKYGFADRSSIIKAYARMTKFRGK